MPDPPDHPSQYLSFLHPFSIPFKSKTGYSPWQEFRFFCTLLGYLGFEPDLQSLPELHPQATHQYPSQNTLLCMQEDQEGTTFPSVPPESPHTGALHASMLSVVVKGSYGSAPPQHPSLRRPRSCLAFFVLYTWQWLHEAVMYHDHHYLAHPFVCSFFGLLPHSSRKMSETGGGL